MTVAVFRPGMLDTPMQARIRGSVPEDALGRAAAERFTSGHQAGGLRAPGEAAAQLVMRLRSPDNGGVWSAAD